MHEDIKITIEHNWKFPSELRRKQKISKGLFNLLVDEGNVRDYLAIRSGLYIKYNRRYYLIHKSKLYVIRSANKTQFMKGPVYDEHIG